MRKTLLAVAVVAGLLGGLTAVPSHAAELQGTVDNDLDESGAVYVVDAGERIALHAGAARARQLGTLDGATVILQGRFDGDPIARTFTLDDARPIVVEGVSAGAGSLRIAVRESIAVRYTHGALAPVEGRAVWAVAKFEGRGFTLEVRHWADADSLGARASR